MAQWITYKVDPLVKKSLEIYCKVPVVALSKKIGAGYKIYDSKKLKIKAI